MSRFFIQRSGQFVQVSETEFAAHQKTPLPIHVEGPPASDEPTVADLATNFAGATLRWLAEGAPVVSEASYTLRAAACSGCEMWDENARFGLGRCNAPGCGCTKLKRWLATEKCPLGKWLN